MNPFVIFGFLVWFILTVAAWIVGLAGICVGIQDEDGAEFGVGVAIFLAGLLSTSFFLSTLD